MTLPQDSLQNMGDFNQIDTGLFNKYLSFKQIVDFPTRGSNILDKVFTNIARFYSRPICLPPLGRSDHSCVLVGGEGVQIDCAGFKTVTRRRMNDSTISLVGRTLLSVNWSFMHKLDSCQQQADFFYNVVDDVFSQCVPRVTVRVKNNERPWINDYFKKLVDGRDAAWRSGDLVLFRKLRNRANRTRISLRTQYYIDEVEQLKQLNPRDWWRHVKAISGINKERNNLQFFNNVTFNNTHVDINAFPECFNNFMSSLIADVRPLDSRVLPSLRNSLDSVPDTFIVDEFSVFNVLNRLKVDKSAYDKYVDNRVLKKFSEILAGPVCALINSSIREGYVPTQWKMARVTPIPKVFPPVSLSSDFRPISITSSISKVAEYFLCNFFNEHFNKFLDSNQFGCTSKRSTTFALIKFSHFLFTESDKQHNILRILFVDFMKAFDLVDTNVLFRKLVELDFPRHVTTWFLSFLDNRQQFVKVDKFSSSFANIHAGTPQGTISGPNDFRLLINDLRFDLHYIKYVDDTTAVSSSDDPFDNALQASVDNLCDWCAVNGMRINVPKTKEMVIYFGKTFNLDFIPMLKIDNGDVVRVCNFKLLGVVFSSDLTWHAHTSYILDKVSRRLFIIWQLVRCGISFCDIIVIYCSIIRSVMEYACPVWHCGLTKGESSDLERVQKRVLRIMYPNLCYKEALELSNLERLDERRERITKETFEAIKEPSHILYNLLPLRVFTRDTRDNYPFLTSKCRTSRHGRSFINYCISRRY